MGSVRLHLWRLEIVPMLAFFASLGAMARHYRIVADFPALVMLPNRLLGTLYSSVAVFLIVLWLYEVRINRGWVACEERKRFHWMILPMHVLILTLTWAIVQTASIESLIVEQSRSFHVSAPLFFLIVVSGIVYTVIMEATRPFVQYDRMREPDPPEPDESGVYVDRVMDWLSLITSSATAAMIATPAVYGDPLSPYSWALCAAIVVTSTMSYRRVTISRDSIVARYGFVRKTIPISDIVECRAVLHSRYGEPLARASSVMENTTGRCLELKLRNGKRKSIWMVRPSYACSILKPMIEAARPPEPADMGVVG